MPAFRLALALTLASAMPLLADEEANKPKPKFKLGKDTTFVTEPLDPDGWIDYETALNKLLKGKSTPQSNAVVKLLQVLGPRPEGPELKPDFYRWLGVSAPPAERAYLLPHSTHFQQEFK